MTGDLKWLNSIFLFTQYKLKIKIKSKNTLFKQLNNWFVIYANGNGWESELDMNTNYSGFFSYKTKLCMIKQIYEAIFRLIL